MANQKPNWVKTNTSWRNRCAIWEQWSLGDDIKDTIKHFELHRDEFEDAPFNRETIGKVRDELKKIDIGTARRLLDDKPNMLPFLKEQRPDIREELESSKAIPNWIDDHKAKTGKYPPLPDCLLDIPLQGYSLSQPISKDMQIKVPSMQLFRGLSMKQRRQLRELVEWLGKDSDEYLHEMKLGAAPGGDWSALQKMGWEDPLPPSPPFTLKYK